MIILSCLLLLAQSPELPGLDGEQPSRLEREVLDSFPSGRHLGSLADLWLVDVQSQQTNGGGIARLDRLYLSAHGRSFTQGHFLWNGLNLSSPDRPGTPMLTLPWHAPRAVEFASLNTTRPGVHFELQAKTVPTARLELGYGAAVGGGTWIPRQVFDREPAFDFGAPKTRRRLDSNLELRGSAHALLPKTSSPQHIALFVEHIEHERSYPITLSPNSNLSRQTLLAAVADLHPKHGELRIIAAAESTELADLGASARLPSPWIRQRQRSAGALSANYRRASAKRSYEGGMAVAIAREEEQGGGGSIDLLNEWFWLERAQYPQNTSSFKFTTRHQAQFEFKPVVLNIDAEVSAGSYKKYRQRPAQTLITAGRGLEAGYVVLNQSGRPSETTLIDAQLSAQARHRFSLGYIDASVNVDHQGLLHNGVSTLQRPGFGAHVSGRLKFSKTKNYGGLAFVFRHQPQRFSAEYGDFLDPLGDTEIIYRHADDGNGEFNSGELGPVLRRGGSPYHDVSEQFSRPSSENFALSYFAPRLGPIRATFQLMARFTLRPLTVRYDEQTQSEFNQVIRDDPTAERPLVAYERQNEGGQERYLIQNQDTPTAFYGAAFQIYSDPKLRAFFNLSATGYWSWGNGAFGVFPDANDVGILSERSADPNQYPRQDGRIDSDRSYGVNLLAGVNIVKGLSATTAIKYRDGQPISRFVQLDLPQGPTVVQGIWTGRARHTFQASWDVHLRYADKVGPVHLGVDFAVYNLLGSGTELIEDLRDGPNWRDPLEIMPGRMLFASLTLGI